MYSLHVGELGYAMKLVDGETLRERIRDARERYRQGQSVDEPLERAERLDILLMIWDAMAFAHARDVLHRDLKPENLAPIRSRVFSRTVATIWRTGAGPAWRVVDDGVE